MIVRLVQSYFILEISYYELKWLLLGEWLASGFVMYKQTYDYTGPIAAAIYKGLNLLFGRSPMVNYVLSTILITVQAGIFNSLLLKNKVYNENSYLPAFLYAILAVSVVDYMTLSPALMSLTFILMALSNIIRRIDNQATDELFLSSGIYIGVATMIYLPSGVFLLVYLFSLILFSSAVPRRLLLYVFGFLLVFVFCGLYYYLFDSFQFFVDRALLRGVFLPSRLSLDTLQILTLGAPFALMLLLSLLKKFGQLRLTNFQQKVEQVMWFIFVGGIATFFLSNERVALELYFVVPVVAYFWTHYFVLLRRSFFKVVMPFLLVFGVLSSSLYFYHDTATSLLVTNTGENKKVMMIGEKLEIYTNTEVATPFLNAVISEDINKELDTYTGAENFNSLFLKIQPDEIWDEQGVFEKIFFRLPEIERTYQRQETNKYRRTSN